MMRTFILALIAAVATPALAYPPAVGIAGKSRSCNACHKDTGPWTDEARTVVDLIDTRSKSSTRQPDGSFQVTAARGETLSLLAIIGRVKGDATPPNRNGWVFVDPATIGTPSIAKTPPGWELNVPYGCRLSGDSHEAYPDAAITVAPLTLRATAAAKDGLLEWHLMLTTGQGIKGKATEGLSSISLIRKIALRVK